MYKLIVCAAISLTLVSGAVMGQSSLTAKATNVGTATAIPVPETDRVRDGFTGPVRRVRTEVVKLASVGGKFEEGRRAVLETAEYDANGTKVQNQYFPLTGSALTGREVYKYDDKGNISEMTLLNKDGSLLSREVYKYEFDPIGNWVKMTTSVLVIKNDKIEFEPTEITYRTIFYHGNSSPINSVATELPPRTSLDKLTVGPVQPMTVNVAASLADINKMVVVMNNNETPPAPRRPPVSGGVLNGKALSLPPPAYPEAARRMRTAGKVEVEVIVDETGKVISAHAVSGPNLLREASVQAANRARFSPTKLSGQAVTISGKIEYNFTMP